MSKGHNAFFHVSTSTLTVLVTVGGVGQNSQCLCVNHHALYRRSGWGHSGRKGAVTLGIPGRCKNLVEPCLLFLAGNQLYDPFGQWGG